jgi:hypothetical protein
MCVGQQPQQAQPTGPTDKDISAFRSFYNNPSITKENFGSLKLMDEEMLAQPDMRRQLAEDPAATAYANRIAMQPSSLLPIRKITPPDGSYGDQSPLTGIRIDPSLSRNTASEAAVIRHEMGHAASFDFKYKEIKNGGKFPAVDEELRQRVSDLDIVKKLGDGKSLAYATTEKGITSQIEYLLKDEMRKLDIKPKDKASFIENKVSQARELNALINSKATSYNNSLGIKK